MAERGTKHEAVVAEMKLASLRGRYDFSTSPQPRQRIPTMIFFQTRPASVRIKRTGDG
jgi:hypothetical protein